MYVDPLEAKRDSNVLAVGPLVQHKIYSNGKYIDPLEVKRYSNLKYVTPPEVKRYSNLKYVTPPEVKQLQFMTDIK